MVEAARIPFERLPGFARWGAALESLLNLEQALWIHGEAGSGVSSLGAWMAARRDAPFMDDAELQDSEELADWVRMHPSGVIGSHCSPEDSIVADIGSRCVALRLFSLEEDPEAVSGCLESLALAEGLEGTVPAALGALPCPGNLRGLRNRVLRWKLLGQLPSEVRQEAGGPLPLEAEDLASNLHLLERLLLHRALRRSYGNRVEAARRLGVSRRQLYLLVARHGDPVRGEAPTAEGPKRLHRKRQNSSPLKDHR